MSASVAAAASASAAASAATSSSATETGRVAGDLRGRLGLGLDHQRDRAHLVVVADVHHADAL